MPLRVDLARPTQDEVFLRRLDRRLVAVGAAGPGRRCAEVVHADVWKASAYPARFHVNVMILETACPL